MGPTEKCSLPVLSFVKVFEFLVEFLDLWTHICVEFLCMGSFSGLRCSLLVHQLFCYSTCRPVISRCQMLKPVLLHPAVPRTSLFPTSHFPLEPHACKMGLSEAYLPATSPLSHRSPFWTSTCPQKNFAVTPNKSVNTVLCFYLEIVSPSWPRINKSKHQK